MSTFRIDSNNTGWEDYLTILNAVTTNAATGPHLYLVASNHDENANWVANSYLDFGTLGYSWMVSVNIADESYLRGAIFENNTAYIMYIRGLCFIKGVLIKNQKDILIRNFADRLDIRIIDGALGIPVYNSSIYMKLGNASNNGANRIDIIKSEIIIGHPIQGFILSGNAKVRISSCYYTGQTLTNVLHNGGPDGINIDFDNCDFNGCTNLGSNGFDLDEQNQNISYKRCIAGAGAGVDLSTDWAQENANIEIWGLKRGTEDSYHYFESVYKNVGKTVESTIVTRTNGATYDGTNGFSAEFLPNSRVLPYINGLRFRLRDLEIDMSSAKYLDIFILQNDSGAGTPVALTDHEFRIIVTHPDGTDISLGVDLSSRISTIMDTPVNLPTEAIEEWTGIAGNKTQQYARVQLPVVSMTNAPVTIHAELFKEPGITERVFVCVKPKLTLV